MPLNIHSLQKMVYHIKELCREQRGRGRPKRKLQALCILLNLSAAVELDLEVREEQKTTTRFKALKEMKRYDRQKIKQVWETPGLALGQSFKSIQPCSGPSPLSPLHPAPCSAQRPWPAIPSVAHSFPYCPFTSRLFSPFPPTLPLFSMPSPWIQAL